MREVMIVIKDAKYYQDAASLVIVGIDVETKKPITQQVSLRSFLEGTGIFTPQEIETILKDPDRCRFFANELKNRKSPFRLTFEGSKTKDDLI